MSRSGLGLSGARRGTVAQYSRFVGLMKVMLPAIAVALLGLLMLWPRLQTARVEGSSLAGARGAVAGGVDTLSMRHPRYFGTDDHNLPFTITADQARELDSQNLTVALDKPEADFTRADGSGVVVSADHGVYTQKASTLDLSGNVALYLDSGYELHTGQARVLLGKSQVEGDGAFAAQGPAGDLAGQGFRVADSGAKVDCLGQCRASLRAATGGKDGQ